MVPLVLVLPKLLMEHHTPIAGPSNGHTASHPPLGSEMTVNGAHEPTLEELERELPYVGDGQVPLGELVSRTVQSIYAELTELAET